jgi:hypothetical protein
MVTMVSVEVVSANSVRVSWDSIDIPEITGYTVYYSQTGNRERQSEEGSVTVPSSDNSVVIEGLVNNEEYQFQVAVIAVLDGDMIIGQRSMLSTIVVALPVTTPVGPGDDSECSHMQKECVLSVTLMQHPL